MDNKLKNKKQYKFYHSRWHILWFIIEMLLVFIGCLFGFPYLIDLISTHIIKLGSDSFLSGLIGIIVGFLFDYIFISRIRRVNRYRALLSSLNREFDCMIESVDAVAKNFKLEKAFQDIQIAAFYHACKNDDVADWVINDDNQSTVLTKYVAIENGTKRILNEWGLGDVVSSVENDSLFLNLPSAFLLKDIFKKHPNIDVANCLHDINGAIRKFNEYNDPRNRVEELKWILINIKKFGILTNKENYKEYKKQKADCTIDVSKFSAN